jgi:signal transduction histidine kinase/CheY-like chemotaxis protein
LTEFVAALPFWPRKLSALTLILLMGISAAIALVLLNRGRFHAASWVYLSGIWLTSTLIIILGGGARSPDTTFYIALCISAVWLVGYRMALAVAGICAGSLLLMALMDVNGLPLPSYFPGKPVPNWVNFTVALVISLVPIARVVQILKEALSRSQSAETALREHQEHLEELVQCRTAELVQARDQAQAANKAKSVFLANMSHELRTPLNTILGFSNLLREDRVTNQQRQDLDVIKRSGEHLLNLINDVLDVAKIDSGRVELAKCPVDLPELLRDVTDLMRVQAEEKGLELLNEESPLLPGFVWSDAGKLRQVLINLLGNAVKYTAEGSITLRVNATPSEPLLLTFEVEDTGIGIAPEDEARVFEAFVQVSQKGAQKGTGLGLTITRQFVELMGGTIHVQSKQGGGSLFRVELPVEEARDVKANLSRTDEVRIIGLKSEQPEYRILIVEDEPANWGLLRRILQNVGFQVRIAENGARGVEMFRRWQPHFIWMDWRMPVMDGREATRRIRALEGGTEVKIVAVTASVFASERDSVLAAGVDDFVRKPYRLAEIFERMASHLGVQYVFESVPPVVAQKLAVLQPEDLKALPEELRTELADALLRLDITSVSATISRVRELNPALGATLANWAGRLAYSEILSAIESLERPSVANCL